NYYDIYANPVEKPVFKKPVPAGVTAKTVFQGYIDAIGGEQKVKAVKSLAKKGKGSMQGMELNYEQKATSKGQFALVLSGMGMELMKQVITPNSGYMNIQGQKQEITGDELKKMQENIHVFEELAYLENV